MNPDKKSGGEHGAGGAGINSGRGGADGGGSGSNEMAQANNISEHMLNARDSGNLVYCRFGDKYLADMER